jgi:hypothetical protein
MDFDYTTETIIPDATNVLTIGGDGGLELPVGTTAQRPGSASNGLLRYNTDNGQVEIFYSNRWASSIASVANRVIVQKTPGASEFSSIADAVASITTSSISTPWEVIVYPGTYIEPTISMPPYTHITGSGEYNVVVKPASSSQDLFILNTGTSVNFLQVYDVGTGYSAFVANNVGNFALCHKVGVFNSHTGWTVSATTADSLVFIEYCDTSGGDIGFDISSSGASIYVNLENYYAFAYGGVNPAIGVRIAGPDSSANLQTFGFEGDDNQGIGLQISDGAYIDAKAGHFFGWDIGAYVPNVGTGPLVNFTGVAFSGNATKDLRLLHPDTLGTLIGTASHYKVDAATTLFTSAFADAENNQFVQTGSLFLGQTQASLTDVTPLIVETPPMGLLSGGVVSVDSGLTLAITAGKGYIQYLGNTKLISWNATTIAVSPYTAPYIYIDNDGVIAQSPVRTNNKTTITLARCLAGATSMHTVAPEAFNISQYGNDIDVYLRSTIGPVFVSGSIVSENATTPRALDITAGSWYISTQNENPAAAIAPTMLDMIQVSGVTMLDPITQISNSTYLSGGNLVSVTSGYFTKHTVYAAGNGADTRYILQHADAQYATLELAIEAPLPTPLISPDDVPTIAAIITQEGATNIAQILDIRPIMFRTGSGSASSGVSFHGDLSGLSNNDHPQYLLVNGTSAMAGVLNLATNDITNAGVINGVTIQTHASRHLPNGSDPLTTAAAVTLTLASTNTVGIQNSLARSDHTHQITGAQPVDATLTALAAYNTAGLLTQTAADTFTGRTITGTASRVSVTNGNGVSGNPTINIDTAYAGQASIITLGTVSTGVWNGTAIAAANGGTGQTTYAVGDMLYASTTTALSKLADVATGNALLSGGVGSAPTWGKVDLTTHVTNKLSVANGGTNLTTIGSANQILGVNTTGTTLSYKTLTAGAGISFSHTDSTITISSTVVGAVTSVGLAMPSIFTVSGSPVTSSGTLSAALATQAANSVLAGPTSGGAAVPAFRQLALSTNDVDDVVITSPIASQVLAYDSGTSKWINTGTVGANASGTVGVLPTGGGTVWTFVSGTRYRADFVHNLGTTNIVVTVWDTATDTVVIPQTIANVDADTVRITVSGNTKTLKVVVVANGQSIVAGGSTPSSVVTAYNGITVSTAATKLNFVGQGVKVTDAGSGITDVFIGARFTYFANSLDTPNNADYAVNSLAPVTTDPTYSSLNVRSFSNTTEQGIGCVVSIPSGATSMTVKMRGRAQTAPVTASVVQPRLYSRALPDNGIVSAWASVIELSNIAIPTNSNFQYSSQTASLSSFGLTPGVLYQFEITRRVAGVTGTNLASSFLLAELTFEFM